MGTNYIFLNKRRTDFTEKSLFDLQVFPMQVLRNELKKFIEHNRPTVILVDCSRFKYPEFSLFLKLLEDENFHGSVWFYNAPLTKYPMTVRSRCDVVGRESHLDLIREFLRSKEALTDENVKNLVYLQQYPIETAWGMLQDRSSFVSFLVDLHQAKPGSFYVLMERVTEDRTTTWVALLSEWLAESAVFSEPEKRQCDWMRSKLFKKVLDRMLFEGLIGSERHIFEFIVTYRLAEVVK